MKNNYKNLTKKELIKKINSMKVCGNCRRLALDTCEHSHEDPVKWGYGICKKWEPEGPNERVKFK